jgi:hypothetical protein
MYLTVWIGYWVFNRVGYVLHLCQECSDKPIEPVKYIMRRCSEHVFCLSTETLPVFILTGLRDEIVPRNAYTFGKEGVDLSAK